MARESAMQRVRRNIARLTRAGQGTSGLRNWLTRGASRRDARNAARRKSAGGAGG